jgi:hypothetical protein
MSDVGMDSSPGFDHLICCDLGGVANSLKAGAQRFKLRWYVDGIRKIRHLCRATVCRVAGVTPGRLVEIRWSPCSN